MLKTLKYKQVWGLRPDPSYLLKKCSIYIGSRFSRCNFIIIILYFSIVSFFIFLVVGFKFKWQRVKLASNNWHKWHLFIDKIFSIKSGAYFVILVVAIVISVGFKQLVGKSFHIAVFYFEFQHGSVKIIVFFTLHPRKDPQHSKTVVRLYCSPKAVLEIFFKRRHFQKINMYMLFSKG